MKAKLTENMPLIPAMPVIMIATKDGDTINFAPHGQCGQINYKPAIISVSVMKEHKTAKNIEKTKRFSVNIPSPDLIEKVKYCGGVSGNDMDKSKMFHVEYGTHDVPLMVECTISLNCQVLSSVDAGECTVYIAEVIETYAKEEFVGERGPDVEKFNPLMCSLDGKFWSLVDGRVGEMGPF